MTLNQAKNLFTPGIVQDPQINNGRPVIKGTRVFVDLVIGLLESGLSELEILRAYPSLTPQHVRMVQQLSADQVQYIKGYADALENSGGER